MLVFSYCVDSLMSKLVVTGCVNCLVIQADSVIQNKHTHKTNNNTTTCTHQDKPVVWRWCEDIYYNLKIFVINKTRLPTPWNMKVRIQMQNKTRVEKEIKKKKKKREKKLNKSSTQWQPLSSAVLMTLTCESHCSLPCLEWRLKVAATVTGSVYMRKRNKQTY